MMMENWKVVYVDIFGNVAKSILLHRYKHEAEQEGTNLGIYLKAMSSTGGNLCSDEDTWETVLVTEYSHFIVIPWP
jgi:S-adenosylmethionine hydrolase